jgi:hypothetical protein
MGILDEAIREHLELKRQHGADDSELRQLEDEAFGPPGRPGDEEGQPDPLAEAETEFMEQPDLGEAPEDGAGEADAPRAASSRREPAAGIADLQEAPEQPEDREDEPAEEEQPAAEHEAIPSPPVEHSTEERHAIADQPTEMFDVEEELSAQEGREPSDEDLVAEEISEPRLAPADPIANFEEIEGEAEVKIEETGAEGEEEEEGDDFFDEQRLSDELDQALEAPGKAEPEEEEELEPEDREEDEPEDEEEPSVARRHDEDLLEETPDFLEEAPEDDQLWFEQKPPKDFDFDD